MSGHLNRLVIRVVIIIDMNQEMGMKFNWFLCA